jgi:hypothetical protein
VSSESHDAVADDAGAASVSSRDSGGVDAWSEVDKIVASDGVAGDRFDNRGLAISPDWLLVGAYLVDGGTPTTSECGAAYGFEMPLFAEDFESATTRDRDSAK